MLLTSADGVSTSKLAPTAISPAHKDSHQTAFERVPEATSIQFSGLLTVLLGLSGDFGGRKYSLAKTGRKAETCRRARVAWSICANTARL